MSTIIKPEVIIKGKAVSRGVAYGKVVCLYGENRQFFRVTLKKNEIDPEVRRLKTAFKKAVLQLTKLSNSRSLIPNSGQEIFEAQILILQDGSLALKSEAYLKENQVNAEWALKHIFDEYISRFKAIDDAHIREKYVDLEDIAERILNNLSGNKKAKLRLGRNSIIAAKELRPSTLIELNGAHPVGLISEHGGWTSHTFILARESGIPAVTGLKKVMRKLESGDEIIIDGYLGQILVNPPKQKIADYKKLIDKSSVNTSTAPIRQTTSELKTLDNKEIIIRANADTPSMYNRAKREGVRGIGLYRSEFLFNRYGHYPNETQQCEEYSRLAQAVGKDRVNIRTFDLSVSQLLDNREEKEANPALGLRGIRLSLKYPKEFKVQIRSILRASSSTTIDVVLPMITGLTDIIEVKKMIKRERDSLIKKNIEVGDPRLGIMVEVPSTLFILEDIVKEIDFICLGTNDLSQYLLASDRDNETVSPWYRTLHPAIIKAIRMVVEACASAKKQLIFCGEMSGSPFYVPILIGLGATELSMNANSVQRVKKVIAGIAYEEAATLVSEIFKCKTAQEIEDLTTQTLSSKWSHLYPQDFLQSRGF